MALPTSKRPWQALAEVTGINVFVQLFDRYGISVPDEPADEAPKEA